jgi:hypothetical protein
MSKKEQRQFRKMSKVMVNALNKRNHIANIGADFTQQHDG